MRTCDYCGKELSLFSQVTLADGRVCQDCYHRAYGECIMPDNVKVSWIAMNIAKRQALEDDFSPTHASACGILVDTSQRTFMYDNYIHRCVEFRSYNAFLNGSQYKYYKRDKTYSTADHKVAKRAPGTCVFIQLQALREYPAYFKIEFRSKAELDECLEYLNLICDLGDEAYESASRFVQSKMKEYELQDAQAQLKRDLEKIEKLKRELYGK